MKFIIFFTIFFFQQANALDFKKLETESGINFWFVKDKSIPIVSVSFSFRGGSSLDSQNQQGISNLMTSLMDEGTRNLSSTEFKKEMKMIGMKLNFSSQKDKINGNFQIISSEVEKGFNLFYEALNFPDFKLEDIERTKKQIIASIKIDDSDLSTLASNKFNENFFKNHKFSKTTKGSISSLNKIKRNDLISFHKIAFQKSNLVIGVAGNINEEKIKKFVGLVFGELTNKKDIPKLKKFETLGKGKKIFNLSTPQTSVLFGHPGLARNDEEYFSLRIANYVFGGGGFQSRLYKRIREKKGLVYSIYSYLLSYQSDGVIVGGFQTRNEYVYETISNVKDEWKKIKNKGISKTELNNAKAYFNGSFTRNFTSTLSISGLLEVVQYYNLGEDYFQKRETIINNLDLKRVNKVLSDIFDNDKLFFMIVGEPKEE